MFGISRHLLDLSGIIRQSGIGLCGIIQETETGGRSIDLVVKEGFVDAESEGKEAHEVIGELVDFGVVFLTGGGELMGVRGPDFV